jgi:DNA-binding Lrp family transcriptional regulator
MLSGETDFILKVVAEDWEAFQRILTQVTSAANVLHVKSAPVMRRCKYEPGIPIDEKVETAVDKNAGNG